MRDAGQSRRATAGAHRLVSGERPARQSGAAGIEVQRQEAFASGDLEGTIARLHLDRDDLGSVRRELGDHADVPDRGRDLARGSADGDGSVEAGLREGARDISGQLQGHVAARECGRAPADALLEIPVAFGQRSLGSRPLTHDRGDQPAGERPDQHVELNGERAAERRRRQGGERPVPEPGEPHRRRNEHLWQHDGGWSADLDDREQRDSERQVGKGELEVARVERQEDRHQQRPDEAGQSQQAAAATVPGLASEQEQWCDREEPEQVGKRSDDPHGDGEVALRSEAGQRRNGHRRTGGHRRGGHEDEVVQRPAVVQPAESVGSGRPAQRRHAPPPSWRPPGLR